MDKELTIYLEDHLAMIVGEMELAERCRNQNPASELARHLEQQLATG